MSLILDALKRAEQKFHSKRAPEPFRRVRTTAEVLTQPSGSNGMTDLQQLIEQSEKSIPELESELDALKHNHDILVEASRLLEEDVLTTHRNV